MKNKKPNSKKVVKYTPPTPKSNGKPFIKFDSMLQRMINRRAEYQKKQINLSV
jgi:hypothetical protein